MKFNLGGSAPRCPLCHNFMEKKFHPARRVFLFVCDTPKSCRIAIQVDDSFVGRWEEALKGDKILCPNPRCPKAPDGEMRYFATRVGFMKAYCPACDATISNAEPDRKKDEPEKFYSPENPGTLQ